MTLRAIVDKIREVEDCTRIVDSLDDLHVTSAQLAEYLNPGSETPEHKEFREGLEESIAARRVKIETLRAEVDALASMPPVPWFGHVEGQA